MKNHLSEEILDILNESPRWVVRMGATVILFLLILFLAGAWFIRYPEVLKGSAKITSSSPTLKVVALGEGRLMRLLVSHGTHVQKGQVLAEMENRTKLENTSKLERLLHQTQGFLQDPKRAIELPNDTLTWGDLQADVMALTQHYLDYQLLKADPYQSQQILSLQKQLTSLRALQQVHQRKKSLNSAAFQNINASYQTDQKLYSEGLYSKTEFQKKENEYLDKKRGQEDFDENLIKNDLKMAELEAALSALEYTFLEKQREHLSAIGQAAHNIENGLRSWQQQFLLTAPSDGKLVYLQNLAENQHIKSGETLFSIIPERQDFIAEVDLPVQGMGKAKVGQKVVLKLADYPYQEFGSVEGAVLSMSPSATLGVYRMTVALPNGLQSSYHHTFECKSELSGTAEIITEDLRLFERAFYGIRKLVL